MSLQYSPTLVTVVDAFESVVIGPDCWAYAIFNNIEHKLVVFKSVRIL